MLSRETVCLAGGQGIAGGFNLVNASGYCVALKKNYRVSHNFALFMQKTTS